MQALQRRDPPETQLSLYSQPPQYLDEIVFPSQNQAGVPLLDLTMQAESVTPPFLVWGSIARSRKMPGTYAFYCDDYKFTGLWANPDKLVKTGCASAVEVNFSINDTMPPAVALYRVFQKRWLARYWQTQGVPTIVDLNACPRYAALNLLGVPAGWRIYCTRVHKGMHHVVEDEYRMAKEHAGCEPIFIVYGGDNGFARKLCDNHGWLWIPDKRSALKWGTYHG